MQDKGRWRGTWVGVYPLLCVVSEDSGSGKSAIIVHVTTRTHRFPTTSNQPFCYKFISKPLGNPSNTDFKILIQS